MSMDLKSFSAEELCKKFDKKIDSATLEKLKGIYRDNDS